MDEQRFRNYATTFNLIKRQWLTLTAFFHHCYPKKTIAWFTSMSKESGPLIYLRISLADLCMKECPQLNDDTRFFNIDDKSVDQDDYLIIHFTRLKDTYGRMAKPSLTEQDIQIVQQWLKSIVALLDDIEKFTVNEKVLSEVTKLRTKVDKAMTGLGTMPRI